MSSPTSPARGIRTSRTRRTRFVCISDTHNATVKLPQGDVLLHAGDLTNQGSYSELSKAVAWLEKAPFETKIVVAGNHDMALDAAFYVQHGGSVHQVPQNPGACQRLLTESKGITYLDHTTATIRLTSSSGPRTTFTVFGSPYSPCQESGQWAFQYPRDSEDAKRIWSSIPLDTDVLITHTPPHHHCDESVSRRKAMGCEILRRAMWRVRPRLHVCGHVHEGRGATRVRWEIEGGNVPFAEREPETWEDKSDSSKISLVDLTGKRGRALENDGGHPTESNDEEGEGLDEDDGGGGCKRQTNGSYGLHRPSALSAPSTAPEPVTADEPTRPGSGTFGLGLGPNKARSPARSDMTALRGRMGRRETCVVNSAVAATNYPHVGGKRYNKPIVVDLDLPVWAWEMEEEDGAFGLVGCV